MVVKRAKTRGKKLVKVDHHAKKQKRIQYFVAGFLVVLMVTSIFGVMLYADPSLNAAGSQQLELDGYTFTLQTEDGAQFIEMSNTPLGKDQFIGTRYYAFPQEIVEPYFTPSIQDIAQSLLNSTGVFLVINVSNLDITGQDQTFALDYQAQDIARSGIAEILTFAGVSTYAGIAEESQSFQVPIITCENATSRQKVVMFEAPSILNVGLSSVSYVNGSSNCISFYSTDFQTTLDLVETLKFEMVKVYE